MPDFEIPKLSLPTGNSSETDPGSTASSNVSANTGRAVGNTPPACLINKRHRQRIGRRSQKKNASINNAPSENGSESDLNSANSKVEKTEQPLKPGKNRKFFARGNQRKQIFDAPTSLKKCDDTATTLTNSASKKPSQASVGPVKIRKSVGGGSCVKKPQPLNLQNKDASLSIVAKPETNSSTASENKLNISFVINKTETCLPEITLLKELSEPKTNLTEASESEIFLDAETLSKGNLVTKLPEAATEEPEIAQQQQDEIKVEEKAVLEEKLPKPVETSCTSEVIEISSALKLKSPSKSWKSQRALVPLGISRTSIDKQYSDLILKYQFSKSVSQMDLKQARRSGNYQLMRAAGCLNHMDKCSTSSSSTIAMDASSNDLVLNDDEKSYQRKVYYVIQEQNPRFAGMRVLLTIMLNAWRKRRSEVRDLCAINENYKNSNNKAKNQLLFFKSLFRVEQKRNEVLKLQLQHSNAEVNKLKVNCDEFNVSVDKLKFDLQSLKECIDTKAQECEELNASLDTTKSELFKAMSFKREKQAELSNQQRRVQELQNENSELMDEVKKLQIEAKMKEDELNLKIETQNGKLLGAQNRIQFLKTELETFKSQELKLNQSIDSEAKLREQVSSLENELRSLRKYVDATMAKRCKNFWKSTKNVPRGTMLWLHWMAFYMLPSTPAPAQSLPPLPFGLTLEKTMSIIKR